MSAPTRAMGQEQSGEAAGDEENGGNVLRLEDAGRARRLRRVRLAKPKLRTVKVRKPKLRKAKLMLPKRKLRKS